MNISNTPNLKSCASQPRLSKGKLAQSLNLTRGAKDSYNESPHDAMLRTILKEADPVFNRQDILQKKSHPPHNLSTTNSRWDQRVKSFYDPGIRDKNYNRWDTKKLGVLDFMRDNEKVLKNNPRLIQNVSGLHNITQFERKFPTYARYMALPPASIGNDAHNKSTNPGYSRNWNGKPFFS